MTKFKHIHFIVNPASGMVEPILPTVNKVWTEAGLTYDVLVTNPTRDGAQLARTAVEAGAEIVVVYGGDGTVRQVASVLAETDIPLAVLPGGTTNVFAQQLGISPTLAEAAQLLTIAEPHLRHIDVGFVNDTPFLLRLAIGLTANMIAGTTVEDKANLGRGAYVLSFLRQLPEMAGSEYNLRLDGHTVNLRGVICLIAICGELGLFNLRWAAGAEIDDGLLDVIVVGEQATALATAALNMLGQQTVTPQDPSEPISATDPIHHWRVQKVTLETTPAVAVQIDGDLLDLTMPLNVTIKKQALTVLVPSS